MRAMHHLEGDASRSDGVVTNSPGDETPCHAHDAAAACAAMVACAGVSALPAAVAHTGIRAGSLTVTAPSRAAPRLAGTAPDTPPPKA